MTATRYCLRCRSSAFFFALLFSIIIIILIIKFNLLNCSLHFYFLIFYVTLPWERDNLFSSRRQHSCMDVVHNKLVWNAAGIKYFLNAFSHANTISNNYSYNG